MAIVHPILRKLMEDSGETVNLAVLDQSDHQAIIIDRTVYPTDAHVRADWREAADARFRRG